MQKIKCACILLLISGIEVVTAQHTDLHGQITAKGDVDGIHILNVSSQIVAVSNSEGQFVIPAKLNDTLTFSGISYESKQIVLNPELINSKIVTIYLKEHINILDEVVVGKVLTGNLKDDLANSGLKPKINFYNLGIPGYTGKPKTQTERRLYTAGDFKLIHLLSLLGGSLDVDPIINKISGRTKRLKEQVKFERLEVCLDKMKSEFSDDLFVKYDLDEDRKAEYFYYCLDDPRFEDMCRMESAFATFEFLEAKLKAFKMILQAENE